MQTHDIYTHFSACLAAELQYAALGIHTFPIKPGWDFATHTPLGKGTGKRPYGKLVPHGLKDASTDPDVINARRRQCIVASPSEGRS